MFSRVLAALCAAALVAGGLTGSAESAARGGVAAGFRGAGGFHPPFVRPHSTVPTHNAVPPRAAAPSHVPVPPRTTGPTHTGFKPFLPSRAAFARHHRGFWYRGRYWYGGLPYAAGVAGPFYGSYYDPSDYTQSDPYYDPSDVVGSLPPAVPVAAPYAHAVERHSCESQTVTVPTSSGDKTDVTIVRC